MKERKFQGGKKGGRRGEKIYPHIVLEWTGVIDAYFGSGVSSCASVAAGCHWDDGAIFRCRSALKIVAWRYSGLFLVPLL